MSSNLVSSQKHKNAAITKAAFSLLNLFRDNKSEGGDSSGISKSTLGGLAAGGGTLGAYKGFNDLGNIQSKLKDWDEVMGKHRDSLDFKYGIQQRLVDKIDKKITDPVAKAKVLESFKNNPRFASGGEHFVNTGRASKIIDDYITRARGLSQSSIMGINAGDILKTLSRKDPGAWMHYEMFTNPKYSLDDLRHHMIEKALHYRDAGAYYHNAIQNGQYIFTPEMKKTLEQPGNIAKRLRDFGKLYPNTFANDIVRNAITGVPRSSHLNDIGEALRLAGNKSTIFSTPEVYTKHIMNRLGGLMKLKTPLLTAGSLISGGLLASPYLREQSSFKKKADVSRPEDVLLGGSAVGLSPYLIQRGLDKFTPNKNIGLTYGEMEGPYGMPNIGGGHRGPSKALKSILEEAIVDPKSPLHGYNLDEIVRNKAGIIHAPPKAYNTILDTGLGLFTEPGDFWHGETRTHPGGPAPLGIKAQSRMHLLTDSFANDRLHRGGATEYFRPKKFLDYLGLGPITSRHHYLGYGDNFERAAQLKGYRSGFLGSLLPQQYTRLSEGLTPAVNKDVLDIIANPQTREQVTESLYKNFQKTNPDLASKIKDLASSGKRLVTISGSGRGDYAAARAIELAGALRTQGLKDVTIAAQLGAAFDDPKQMQLLAEYPEILTFGKMPLKDYVNLQRISDMHLGSSGTSSIAESLLQDKPFGVPKDWGFRRWYHGGGGYHITPNTPADTHAKFMEILGHDPTHGQMEVTSWNRGNLQYAHKRPGVFAADTADDIVRVLKDPSLMTSLTSGAKTRAAEEMAKLTRGRKNLLDTVIKEVARNNRLSKLKGLGLVGLGGATLAGGLSKFFGQNKRE
jgi:hypothetical protein